VRPVKNYREFVDHYSVAARLRSTARDLAICSLSLGRSIGKNSGWIRFPYYHHVFDDERRGFARQLQYMSRHGEFISLDEAVSILTSGESIDGNYFCITFDDGFKNNVTNAVPILLDNDASAAFFLVTDLIDSDIYKDRERLVEFFDHGKTLMEFLDWVDCRMMSDAGMVIGSHTVHHAKLSELDESAIINELTKSKTTIEKKLGRPCVHFCAPFGIPMRDFDPERDPELVRQSGYLSMLTTQRGANRKGGSPFLIKRDHVLASWGNHQLRYFLSLD
jgi:hypothetical protein